MQTKGKAAAPSYGGGKQKKVIQKGKGVSPENCHKDGKGRRGAAQQATSGMDGVGLLSWAGPTNRLAAANNVRPCRRGRVDTDSGTRVGA